MTTLRSPLHQALQDLLELDASQSIKDSYVKTFWENANKTGTPLIENIDGDDSHKKVTFLWQAPEAERDNQQVYVLLETNRYSDLNQLPLHEEHHLKHIPGTNIYSVSLTLPADLLTNYSFVVQPNMPDLIARAKRDLATATNRDAEIKAVKEVRDAAENHQYVHPDPNNPQLFFSHPDPSERTRNSILVMPNAPRNGYSSSSAVEAKADLERLIDEERFQEHKIDYSEQQRHLDQRFLYHAGKIEYRFCNSLDEIKTAAANWDSTHSSGTSDILLTRNKEDNQWGIFFKNTDTLVGMPLSVCNNWVRNKEAPRLMNTLQDVTTPAQFEQHRKAIERDVVSLLNERQYYVYLPPNYDPSRHPPYPLMIQLDGAQFVDMNMPQMLDKMISDNLIPPTVVVFCPAVGSRFAEYNCNETFIQFMAEHFIPQMRQDFNCENDHTVVSGASLGGLTSMYLALKYPEKSWRVISQSGALCYSEEKLVAAISQFPDFNQANHPSHFLMDAGSDETGLFNNKRSLINANEAMVQTMRQKGYDENFYQYQPFRGAHSFVCWQASWPHMLASTLQKSYQVEIKETKETRPTSSTISMAAQLNINLSQSVEQKLPTVTEQHPSEERQNQTQDSSQKNPTNKPGPHFRRTGLG